MKIVQIQVNFTGVVTVRVPETMEWTDANKLAERFALSRIMATADNPDAPDDWAFDEYLDHCSKEAQEAAEADWDAAEASVCGSWSLPGEEQP